MTGSGRETAFGGSITNDSFDTKIQTDASHDKSLRHPPIALGLIPLCPAERRSAGPGMSGRVV